jgi:hypothetical protein
LLVICCEKADLDWLERFDVAIASGERFPLSSGSSLNFRTRGLRFQPISGPRSAADFETPPALEEGA